MIKIREINTRFYEKKDNRFYYVIKHSQVECTQKALIFIYGPGKRTEVWRKWEDYGLSFLFLKWTCRGHWYFEHYYVIKLREINTLFNE